VLSGGESFRELINNYACFEAEVMANNHVWGSEYVRDVLIFHIKFLTLQSDKAFYRR
jgi:hypothetical protein